MAGRALWGDLDVARLDASTPAWLASNVRAAERFHQQSTTSAARYVERYRFAELGDTDGPLVVPDFDRAAVQQELLLAGPVRVKLLVQGGMSAASASAGALTKYQGILGRASMMGGRQVIDGTTSADRRAIGWRRVSDGDPCSFCGMLCSRGPVYRSAETAGGPGAGSGMRFHGHCGCTAEIVYGEWKPTEQEQHFIDLYEAAAQEAKRVDGVRTEETVLWRMRRDGDLRDSAARRRATP